MAAISRADAIWEGDLTSGKGRVTPASGAFGELPVTWAARAERAKGGTSPEELLAAAHAACYSMAFSNGLSKAGHKVERLNTTAEVEFVPGTGITTITLTTVGHSRHRRRRVSEGGGGGQGGLPDLQGAARQRHPEAQRAVGPRTLDARTGSP